MIIAAVLSTPVMIGEELMLKISSYRGRIHCAATASDVKVAYSASQVLCAVAVFYIDHHAIGEPPTRKIIPVVTLEDVALPQLLSDEAMGVIPPDLG